MNMLLAQVICEMFAKVAQNMMSQRLSTGPTPDPVLSASHSNRRYRPSKVPDQQKAYLPVG